jgi:hypothetical protein
MRAVAFRRFYIEAQSATFRSLHAAKVLCSAALLERDPSRHIRALNSAIESDYVLFGFGARCPDGCFAGCHDGHSEGEVSPEISKVLPDDGAPVPGLWID